MKQTLVHEFFHTALRSLKFEMELTSKTYSMPPRCDRCTVDFKNEK